MCYPCNFRSKTFNKFLGLLETYRQRVENKFADAVYPAGTALAGQPFNPANGTVSPYSSEVMIPAFLDAYTMGVIVENEEKVILE